MRMKMRVGAITMTALMFGLQGCGSGSDPHDDNPSAQLFADYSDAISGGYRSVRTPISDAAHSASTGCGYVNPVTVDDAIDYVADLGGSVVASSDTKWCGNGLDVSYCVLRAGGSFISDLFTAGSPDQRSFEIVIPDDANDTRAYFTLNLDGTTPTASADIERYTSSIPSSGFCTPSTPTHFASDINGTWKGYRVTYSRGSKTGSEVAATMSCSAGSCVVGSESYGSIPFASFVAVGSWKASWNSRVAGASISEAGDALAMYVCPAPLDETEVVDQCLFYGFLRD